MHTLDIDFDLGIEHITKVEGAADVTVKVRNGKVEEAKYSITEYKRFYTKAIVGKPLMAVPQLLSRICGTCSNAHVLAAIEACERAIGLKPSEQTMKLRRLTMDGLDIRDHALHLYLFVMPDIMGVSNFLELDEEDEEQHQILHDAFDIKAAGNALAELVAGRSVHATYPTLGGFLKVPEDKEEVAKVVEKLKSVREAAVRTVRRFAESPFSLDRKTDFMALMPEGEFEFIDGQIESSFGFEPIKEENFLEHLEHVSQPHSTASAYTYDGKPYMVGSLARINLAKERLHPKTKESCAEWLERFPSTNVHDNNTAQAIEIVHCIDRAIDVLSETEFVKDPLVKMEMKAGTGVGVVEAPRGTLYHRVSCDEKGSVTDGYIMVPTNQNQLNIEADLRAMAERALEKAEKPEDIDEEALVHEMEVIVRAYDPCMSCAAHFMKLKMDIA